MKKRRLIAGFLCVLLVLTTACGTVEPKNESEESRETERDATSAVANPPSQAENETHQEYGIVSFQAVEGAVIYDTEYGENGFPVSCQFHKKCESCGYVSNNNGQARGNLSTSYHCEKCGNNQHVEITATFDWFDVQD